MSKLGFDEALARELISAMVAGTHGGPILPRDAEGLLRVYHAAVLAGEDGESGTLACVAEADRHARALFAGLVGAPTDTDWPALFRRFEDTLAAARATIARLEGEVARATPYCESLRKSVDDLRRSLDHSYLVKADMARKLDDVYLTNDDIITKLAARDAELASLRENELAELEHLRLTTEADMEENKRLHAQLAAREDQLADLNGWRPLMERFSHPEIVRLTAQLAARDAELAELAGLREVEQTARPLCLRLAKERPLSFDYAVEAVGAALARLDATRGGK